MPGATNWPSKNNVEGVKILTIGAMDSGDAKKVSGIELGFVSMSPNVGWVQMPLINIDTMGLRRSSAWPC